MDGLAGPAVAMANLSSVIQALLDWGFLSQIPTLFETLGLVIAIVGAILMAIGDDYIIKPMFYSTEQPQRPRYSKSVKEPLVKRDGDDLEITNGKFSSDILISYYCILSKFLMLQLQFSWRL